MKSNRKLVFALVLASAVTLTGCGGGAQVDQHSTSISQGQELTDLKRALDAGAIDQTDYDKLQKKILSRGY